jgi:hypothetical protein
MNTDYEKGYKQFAEMVGAAYAGFAAAWDALEKLAEVLDGENA